MKYDFEAEKRNDDPNKNMDHLHKYDLMAQLLQLQPWTKLMIFIDQKLMTQWLALKKQIGSPVVTDTPFGYEEELEGKNEQLKEVMIRNSLIMN